MRLDKVGLLILVALLGGLAVPEGALARGGGGGGRGGGGRGGGGRGGGRGGFKGRNGDDLDRKGLIEVAEEDMRNSDRDQRFATGRKADFDMVQRTKREEVLARHRRMGEDSRRQEDARLDVGR